MRAPPVRIFDRAMNLMHEVDRYGELYYTRARFEPGDFGFSMPFDENLSNMAEGNFVLVGNEGSRIGIIEEIALTTLAQGTKWICVRGHEAKALLAQRITIPNEGTPRITLSAPAESVMKTLVEHQGGASAAPSRRFSDFCISPDRARGTIYSLSCAYSNLLGELIACAKASRLGLQIRFDIPSRSLVFDVIEGIDRSSEQHTQSRALFAHEFDTLTHATLTRSTRGSCTALSMLGAKTSEHRVMSTVWQGEEPCGIARIERAMDMPSIEDEERLSEYGLGRLEAMQKAFFLEAEIPVNAPLVVGTDYELGDLCSVKAYSQWYTVPIDSIEERWTKDAPGIRVGFGRPAQGAFRASLETATALQEALRA